jgi:hypothetical protein
LVEVETVLVLGARASKPYGLPLGWELRRDTCKRWSDRMVLQGRPLPFLWLPVYDARTVRGVEATPSVYTPAFNALPDHLVRKQQE